VIADLDGNSIIVQRAGTEKEYTVDERVSAVVESGGDLRTHPTLTRTVAGFAVTGLPVGAAWWKKTGSVFLLIDGADWAELLVVEAKLAGAAQRFAQQVNLAARTATKSTNSRASETTGLAQADPSAVIDQLERLTKLRDQGVLNDSEFEAQKQRILEA
jgi:hypothetical protein